MRKKVAARPVVEILPLRIGLGENLQALLDPEASRLFPRLESVFAHFSRELGLQVPELTLEIDPGLPPDDYTIHFQGDPLGRGSILVGRFLAVGEEYAVQALLGEPGHEPVYGMPGKWIPSSMLAAASELECMLFEPEAVLITHLVSLLEADSWRLVSLDSVAGRLAALEGQHPELVGLARTQLGLPRLRAILSNLVRSRVSVLDLRSILESVLEKMGRVKNADILTEFARLGIAGDICRAFCREDGRLQALTLSVQAEKLLKREFKGKSGLDPLIGQRLLQQLDFELGAAMEEGARPVLLVDFELRPLLAGLTHQGFPELGVLSWSEIAPGFEVDTVAVLGSRFHPSAKPIPRGRWTTTV